jgi:myo-inositol 2-dehydrogenase/D-chiro-inositol 1-dehydrogenase
MPKLNVALIGCGYWGQKIVETALQINFFKSIKVYDSNVAVVNLIKKKYPQIFCYSSFEELLNDHNTKAVMVATELKQHFYLCKQLLQANKHVLCEKPLAYTAKECN